MKNEYLGFSSGKSNLVNSRSKRGKSIEKKSNVYASPIKVKPENFGSLSGHHDTDSRTYTNLKSNVVKREATTFYKEQC